MVMARSSRAERMSRLLGQCTTIELRRQSTPSTERTSGWAARVRSLDTWRRALGSRLLWFEKDSTIYSKGLL